MIVFSPVPVAKKKERAQFRTEKMFVIADDPMRNGR